MDTLRRLIVDVVRSLALDFRARLAAGARRFREIDRRPKAADYFGWPASARAETGEKVMALRGRLIARDLIAALDGRAPARRQRRRRAGTM